MIDELISRIREHMSRWPYCGADILLTVFLLLLTCSEILHIRPEPGLGMEHSWANDNIQWHDENLEAAVREALGGKITAITGDDVRDIRTLDISGGGIHDITDLSLFEGLRELNLSHNTITDLSPVFHLNLEDIDASYNNIVSIEGISRLKRLHGLRLTGNPLTKDTVRELGNLRGLASLSISLPDDGSWNGNILTRCRLLYRLELTGRVEDYGFLKKLPGIHHLGFYHGDMKSIGPVVNAAKDMELIQLAIVECGMEDLTGIQELENIKALDLSGNQISDTGPLEEMTGIEYLDLSDNRISGNAITDSIQPASSADITEYDMEFTYRRSDYLRARLYREEHPVTLWGHLKYLFWNPLPDTVKDLMVLGGHIAFFLSLPVMGRMRAAAMARREEREPVPENMGTYRVRDIRRWIRYGAGTYMCRFARLKRGIRTFNFSAAFCGPVWFAYRLMWKESLILCAAMASTLSVLAFPGFSHLIMAVPYGRAGGMGIFAVLWALAAGWFADGIYWAYIKRCLSWQERDNGRHAVEEAGISYTNALAALGIIIMLWRIIR